MPRPPQIERHITHTRCYCRCMYIPTLQIYGKILEIPRVQTSTLKQLDFLRKKYDDKDNHILEIERYQVIESYCMMDEITFLKGSNLITEETILFDSMLNS